MLRSELVKTAAKSYIDALPMTIRKMVTQLPVLLQAQSFTGSGVIASRVGSRVLVLTAKHNIKINYKQYRRNVDGVADAPTFFQSKIDVKVFYKDAHDAERNASASAKISQITFFDNTVDYGTGYDIIGLVIDNEDFAEVTDKILSLASLWGSKRKQIWPFLINTGTFVGNSGEMKDAYLLQAGFGQTQKNGLGSLGTLQHRALKNEDALDADYLDEDHSGSKEILVFKSSDTNSTWEGDSGGPCFAISRDKKKVFLVGLNLGSNFYADKTDDRDESPIENNAVTVLNASVEKWLLKQLGMKVALQRKFALI